MIKDSQTSSGLAKLRHRHIARTWVHASTHSAQRVSSHRSWQRNLALRVSKVRDKEQVTKLFGEQICR